MKLKRTPIRIANPCPGGSTYTSAKKAQEYLDREMATLTDDGELYFLSHQQRKHAREQRSSRLISSVYSWATRDSSGSKLVKAGSGFHGKGSVSGGHRVMQAERSKAKK